MTNRFQVVEIHFSNRNYFFFIPKPEPQIMPTFGTILIFVFKNSCISHISSKVYLEVYIFLNKKSKFLRYLDLLISTFVFKHVKNPVISIFLRNNH